MTTDFEKDVKAAFLTAKFGNKINEIAAVDLHFVLPLQAFVRHKTLIHDVTDGDFQVAAGYNLVLLYTEPEDARRAGTVLFGRDLDGLVAAWSNVLDDIAAQSEKSSQVMKFKGAHAHFRAALWVKPNLTDPCASANPTIKRSTLAKKPFWRRFST